MIFPKIKLSERRHVPVAYLHKDLKKVMTPYEALSFVVRSKGMTMQETEEYCLLTHDGVTLKLTPMKASMFVKEFRNWEKEYIPPFPLRGKIVLDVGSGCGETAYLEFKHGASKVICVDPSPEDMSLLIENARSNRWNVETYCENFSLKHLRLPFDYAKVDCEGGEVELLSLDKLDFPLALEAHSLELMNQFREKGLRVLSTNKKGDSFVMNNFAAFANASFKSITSTPSQSSF